MHILIKVLFLWLWEVVSWKNTSHSDHRCHCNHCLWTDIRMNVSSWCPTWTKKEDSHLEDTQYEICLSRKLSALSLWSQLSSVHERNGIKVHLKFDFCVERLNLIPLLTDHDRWRSSLEEETNHGAGRGIKCIKSPEFPCNICLAVTQIQKNQSHWHVRWRSGAEMSCSVSFTVYEAFQINRGWKWYTHKHINTSSKVQVQIRKRLQAPSTNRRDQSVLSHSESLTGSELRTGGSE